MGKDAKEDLIILRVQKSRKESWKQICLEKQISLTSFIIHSVENSDIYESCINLAVTSDSDLWIGVSNECYSVTYCCQYGLVDMPVVETMLELIDDIRTAINHIKSEEVSA